MVSIAKHRAWSPAHFLGDCANALGNGCVAVHSLAVVKTCFAHVWRGIYANIKKLKDSSPARVDLLITDISFISEVIDTELRISHRTNVHRGRWSRGCQ